MSPQQAIRADVRARFPRVSGDEPSIQFKMTWSEGFSPRERG